ncbi:MAG: hypothetical protein ACJAYE_003366 [Candidatus Azotimanducaceae bacterium]|jgi:hypothetical protein
MKNLLRPLFSPLLRPLEASTDPYVYKPSHRKILLFVSVMFIGMATLVAVIMPGWDSGYLLPIIVFGGAGLIGLIVGGLGEDRAVARIWGSK